MEPIFFYKFSEMRCEEIPGLAIIRPPPVMGGVTDRLITVAFVIARLPRHLLAAKRTRTAGRCFLGASMTPPNEKLSHFMRRQDHLFQKEMDLAPKTGDFQAVFDCIRKKARDDSARAKENLCS